MLVDWLICEQEIGSSFLSFSSVLAECDEGTDPGVPKLVGSNVRLDHEVGAVYGMGGTDTEGGGGGGKEYRKPGTVFVWLQAGS